MSSSSLPPSLGPPIVSESGLRIETPADDLVRQDQSDEGSGISTNQTGTSPSRLQVDHSDSGNLSTTSTVDNTQSLATAPTTTQEDNTTTTQQTIEPTNSATMALASRDATRSRETLTQSTHGTTVPSPSGTAVDLPGTQAEGRSGKKVEPGNALSNAEEGQTSTPEGQVGPGGAEIKLSQGRKWFLLLVFSVAQVGPQLTLPMESID